MTNDRVWLDRRTATIEMERRVARAVLEAGGQAPTHPADPRLVPEPADLRGIPCIARGVGGTQPGTRPDTARIE